MRTVVIEAGRRLILVVACSLALLGCEGDDSPSGSGVLTGTWKGIIRNTHMVYVAGSASEATYTINHEGSAVNGTISYPNKKLKFEGSYDDARRTLDLVIHVTDTATAKRRFTLDETGNVLTTTGSYSGRLIRQ